MAKPGRKPDPTVIKKLKGGTKTSHRPMPENEAQPIVPANLPTAPSYLDEYGEKEWYRVAEILLDCGLLTELDLSALSAYCQAFESWVKAVEKCKEFGNIIKAQSGFPMVSPYYTIKQKESDQMRKWMALFGMSPAERTRVKSNKKSEDKNPMEV